MKEAINNLVKYSECTQVIIEGNFNYKTMEINYLNQCSERDSVSIFYKKAENELFYSLKRNSDNKEICRAHFY